MRFIIYQISLAKMHLLGKDESDNVQIKTWGDPLIKENIKSHWEIGESLNIFDSIKSTKISKSRFITLIGNGAKIREGID